MTRVRLAIAASLAVSVLLVGLVRAKLHGAWIGAKAHSSVYSLPPPKILSNVSLGYRSALADYLWAHVLVTQGLRMGERRPFKEMGLYFDAINYLDPTFRAPYRLADSLMCFQPEDPDRVESVRHTRKILERGIELFPNDAQLWLNYGQFLAYIGHGMLPEREERESWRKAGALALVRAGELGGDENAMLKSISAATILSRAGEVDAAIRFLERVYALTEDESTREDVLRRLNVLRQGKAASQDFELSRAFDALWRHDLPFVSRSALSVLGPPVDIWTCAGARRADDPRFCIRNWNEWAEHAEKKGGEP